MKVGDIVKLKNPKNKREAKRRWIVAVFLVETVRVRRLDTATHRLEQIALDTLTPISFWEKLWRRY